MAFDPDNAVWNVHSYPSDEILHAAETYEAANAWRRANDQASYVCPAWPGHDHYDGDKWLIQKHADGVHWLLHEPLANNVPATILPSFDAARELFIAYTRAEVDA